MHRKVPNALQSEACVHAYLLLVSGDTDERDGPVACVASRAVVGGDQNARQSFHLRHVR